MNDRLFAHIPYHFLRDNLPLVIERRINPEVFLPADILDNLIRRAVVEVFNERCASLDLDAVVRAFEDGLLALLRSQHGDILESIRTTKDLTDETAAKLKSVVESFAKSFA